MSNVEIKERIEKIKSDRNHGASWLSRQALYTLKLVAERSNATTCNDLIRHLMQVGKQLVEAHPSMAPLTNTISHAIYNISENSERDLDSLKRFIIYRVKELIENSRKSMLKAALNASKLIQEGTTIITHSYSSTIMEAINQLRGKGVQVIISESRPLYEGRKVAHELSLLEIPVTLIIDSALGHFSSVADVALVGADSVLADGSIINKIGTYLLALAAKESNIPFYVVCETYKFNIKSYLGMKIELEQKESSEITDDISGVNIRNLYFDITPPKFVSQIITEGKEFKPNEVVSHMKKYKKYLEWLKEYSIKME